MKYFVFNKPEDFQRGKWSGQERFLSRILDSREPEAEWHRFVMDYSQGDNRMVLLEIFTAEQEEIDGIRKIWQEREAGEADRSLQKYKRAEIQNPKRDVLLTGVTGRYLWFSLRMWGNDDGRPVIRTVEIFFGVKSWTEFLPELYRDRGSFLERYLAVLQTVYEEMERRIDRGAARLDLESADPDDFQELAEWLDMKDIHLWKEAALRRYLKEGAAVYRRRGTWPGMAELVECYTGERPYLWEETEGSPLLTIYVRERVVPTDQAYHALLKVVEEGRPAWLPIRLIVLRDYTILGAHTYLGINSVVRPYQRARLDEGQMVSMAVLGGNHIE